VEVKVERERVEVKIAIQNLSERLLITYHKEGKKQSKKESTAFSSLLP
jgi:hypothetical protein